MKKNNLKHGIIHMLTMPFVAPPPMIPTIPGVLPQAKSQGREFCLDPRTRKRREKQKMARKSRRENRRRK